MKASICIAACSKYYAPMNRCTAWVVALTAPNCTSLGQPSITYLNWDDQFSCSTNTQQVWMANWMMTASAAYLLVNNVFVDTFIYDWTALKGFDAWQSEKEHGGYMTLPSSLCFVFFLSAVLKFIQTSKILNCPASPIIFQCEDYTSPFWIWIWIFQQGTDKLLNTSDHMNSSNWKKRGREKNIKQVENLLLDNRSSKRNNLMAHNIQAEVMCECYFYEEPHQWCDPAKS